MWARVLAFAARLRFASARRRLDGEARDEFHLHLDLLAERHVRAGMTPEDARLAARRQLGNSTLVQEEIHEMNGFRFVDSLEQDVRYAVRQLRRAPGFAAVVIATLGLGIGGTTAVFSVAQAVLLAPLPYDAPGQLVRFYQQEPDKPDTRGVVAGAYVSWLREHARSFDGLAAMDLYSEAGLDLVTDGRSERLRVLEVTSDYFDTLRSPPRLGRGFDREDESGSRRVVLSDAVWRTHFGSDPAILGRVIRLSAEPYEVVGVVAPGFEDPVANGVAAWLPYALADDDDPQNGSLTAIGRLRPGVGLAQAQAELAALSATLRQRWTGVSKSAIVALPLREDLTAKARSPLHLALLAVGLLLLVACVNVANLVLVRATGRVHEFALRAALGSGRGRLVRQLLVESLLLAGLGGVLGLTLARLGVGVLRDIGRGALPRLDDVGFDVVAVTFAGAVTLFTAVAAAVGPAFGLARTAPGQALRLQSRSATGTRRQGSLRNSLAAAQLALALTLLAGAGVLLASFYRLGQVDLGFRVDRVLTFQVHLPSARYDAGRRAAFQEQLSRVLEGIPGVTAAGGISYLPAAGSYHPWTARALTGPRAGTSIRGVDGLQQRVVSGDLFTALALPVLAGRTFDARDDAGAPSRAVVSASLAERLFPGLPSYHVIGHRIAVAGLQREIIGVVGDVTLDVYGATARVVYHAHSQFASNRNWALTQVVATDLPPERLLADVRAEVARLDPELVVHRAAPMAEVVGRATSRERFALILMGVFACVALLLAALGLYGVLAYTVRQRTQEIGIRMALGATPGRVRALVLRQAAVVAGAGLAAGIAGALLLGHWLSALVFEISPTDPRIVAATALGLASVAAIAAWLPARRASRVEPVVAMRER